MIEKRMSKPSRNASRRMQLMKTEKSDSESPDESPHKPKVSHHIVPPHIFVTKMQQMRVTETSKHQPREMR